MLRIFFALYHAWLQRKCWPFVRGIEKVTLIDLKLINQLRIKVLVLDFDGVLASHGEKEPLPEVKSWLDNFILNFDQNQICILSNKPNPIREQYFKKHYPGILFIKGIKKKPYPEGLLAVQAHYQVPDDAIALVDDRLLTGVLASCLAHTQCLYVTKPFINFKARPIHECFFYSLRWIERRFYKGKD